VRTIDRFADIIPDQKLETFGLTRANAGNIWEEAYSGGFTGAYLDRHVAENGAVEFDYTPLGRAARWHRDEFRDTAGSQRYSFEHQFDRLTRSMADDTEYGYVASVDAFSAWKRDKDPAVEEWLFQFLQNSGNCVGASGVEMFQGILGTRAMNPANNELMKYLAAMWAYMFRGYCGAGWYGSAHASVTVKYGYAFSKWYDLPQLGSNFNYDGEQRSEDLTVRTWCRNQPDDFIQYVADQGWFFESGAISEFSGGVDALKQVIRAKGQLHHGSNYTAGGVDSVRRIGGHMQTMFGGDWSERTLKFFNDQGYRFTTDDFPCVNHQTWGPGFSGECPDRLWPDWWGPKPEGAWVMGAKKQLTYFSDGYVYLPKMKGIPGTAPPQPPTDTKITGTIEGEVLSGNRVRINGTLTADGVAHTPVWTGGDKLEYKFVPKV